MYQFKKETTINEEIKIGDDIITLSLNIDDMASRFISAMENVQNAQNLLNKAKKNQGANFCELFNTYNNAVRALLLVVFGDENAQKIIDFYEGKYLELSSEVFPFLANVVMPKIQQNAESKKSSIINNYRK